VISGPEHRLGQASGGREHRCGGWVAAGSLRRACDIPGATPVSLSRRIGVGTPRRIPLAAGDLQALAQPAYARPSGPWRGTQLRRGLCRLARRWDALGARGDAEARPAVLRRLRPSRFCGPWCTVSAAPGLWRQAQVCDSGRRDAPAPLRAPPHRRPWAMFLFSASAVGELPHRLLCQGALAGRPKV